LSALSVSINERKIAAVFADLDRANAPGAAVGVALHGSPVYRRGFGLARTERPERLTPAFRMRIASVTKHLAAFAYLLLCEDGRAQIDAPVSRFLPELAPIARDVSLRQLMGHVGGLRDPVEVLWSFCSSARSITSAQLLSLYPRIEDRSSPPGSHWNYQNGGYLLLSVAIERIADRPLEDVLRQRIFDPCGMYDTELVRWDNGLIPGGAALYKRDDAGGFAQAFTAVELDGMGGVVSSVDDMLRWLAHMGRQDVGGEATWRALKTPLTVSGGDSTGYSLGLFVDRISGVEVLAHPGGAAGGGAYVLKVPAAGLDVIVIVNRDDVLAVDLAERVVELCLPELGFARGAQKRPLAQGVFRSPTSGRVIELKVNRGQPVAGIDGTDIAVIVDNNGALRPAGVWRHVKQAIHLIGDSRQPQALRWVEPGVADELFPIPKPPSAPTLREGVFQWMAANIEAELIQTDEGAELRTRSNEGSMVYELQCLSADLWRARARSDASRGALLTFEKNGTQFRFSTWHLPNVVFRRTHG
jgi:D-aminopeptidase